MTLAEVTHGSGRPVVLLPWFSLDGSMMAAAFEPVLGRLTGWHRRYVDLPGCGRSAAVAPTSDAVVEAVIEHLDALDGGPVVLVGCSYGGYIAAAVTRRRKDLVRALALVCSGVKIRPEDRTLPDLPPAEGLAWPAHVEPWIRRHLELGLGTDDLAVATRVAALLAAVPSGDEAYLTELRESGYPVSDEAAPTAYDAPMLMVAGRQDRIGGYVDQFEAMARYPHGSYVALDRAGHYLPFEQPEAFAAVLGSWLQTLR